MLTRFLYNEVIFYVWCYLWEPYRVRHYNKVVVIKWLCSRAVPDHVRVHHTSVVLLGLYRFCSSVSFSCRRSTRKTRSVIAWCRDMVLCRTVGKTVMFVLVLWASSLILLEYHKLMTYGNYDGTVLERLKHSIQQLDDMALVSLKATIDWLFVHCDGVAQEGIKLNSER